ncbi:MAG: hypothetical protein KF869_14615 [Phycisphaeraceae bacterium]|nr:hypothetical protein [Phycisphaeraceae bacterium]
MSDHRAPQTDGLSAAGAARKEAILGMLHERLDTRVRRKRATRAGTTVAAMIVLGAGVWIALPGAMPKDKPARHIPLADGTVELRSAPDSSVSEGSLSAASQGRVTVRIVSMAVVDAAPCEIAPMAGVCLLNDEQLLAALAEAGQPSGLVRVGGRAVIVPRDAHAGDLD